MTALNQTTIERLKTLINNKSFIEVEKLLSTLISSIDKNTLSLILEQHPLFADDLLAGLCELIGSNYPFTDTFFQTICLNKYFLEAIEEKSQLVLDDVVKGFGLVGKQNYSHEELKVLLALMTISSDIEVPWQTLLTQVTEIAVFPFVGLTMGIRESDDVKVNNQIKRLNQAAQFAPVLSAENVEDLKPFVDILQSLSKQTKTNTSSIQNWIKKNLDNFVVGYNNTIDCSDRKVSGDKKVVYYISRKDSNNQTQLAALQALTDNLFVVLAPEVKVEPGYQVIYQGDALGIITSKLESLEPDLIIYDSISENVQVSVLANMRIAPNQYAINTDSHLFSFDKIDSFIDERELDNESLLDDKPYKLSICIPTLNRAELLRKSLNHLLTFSQIDIEVNISNNGSTDHTKEVIEEYSDKFSKLNHVSFEKTVGQGDNYFSAMTLATQEFSFVVADDDLPNEAELIKALDLMRRKSELKLVYGTFDIVSLEQPQKRFNNKEQAFSEVSIYYNQQRKDLVLNHLLLEVVVYRTDFFNQNVYTHQNSGIISWWFADKALMQGEVAITPFKYITNFVHKNRFSETEYASPLFYFLIESEVEGFISQIKTEQNEKLALLSNYAIRHCRFKYERCIDYKDYVQAAFFIYKGLAYAPEFFGQYAKHWNNNFLELALEQYLNDYITKKDFVDKVLVKGNLNQSEKELLSRLQESSNKTWLTSTDEQKLSNTLVINFEELGDTITPSYHQILVPLERNKLKIEHYTLSDTERVN